MQVSVFDMMHAPFDRLCEWVRYNDKYPPKKDKKGKNGKKRITVPIES